MMKKKGVLCHVLMIRLQGYGGPKINSKRKLKRLSCSIKSHIKLESQAADAIYFEEKCYSNIFL